MWEVMNQFLRRNTYIENWFRICEVKVLVTKKNCLFWTMPKKYSSITIQKWDSKIACRTLPVKMGSNYRFKLLLEVSCIGTLGPGQIWNTFVFSHRHRPVWAKVVFRRFESLMELRTLELLRSLQASGGSSVTLADDRLANPNCPRRYQRLIRQYKYYKI